MVLMSISKAVRKICHSLPNKLIPTTCKAEYTEGGAGVYTNKRIDSSQRGTSLPEVCRKRVREVVCYNCSCDVVLYFLTFPLLLESLLSLSG